VRSPLHRKWPHQPRRRHRAELLPIQNLLDDVGREKGQTQYSADVGVVDLLSSGNLIDCAIGAGLEELSPPECAGDRLDHGVVDARAATPTELRLQEI